MATIIRASERIAKLHGLDKSHEHEEEADGDDDHRTCYAVVKTREEAERFRGAQFVRIVDAKDVRSDGVNVEDE